MRKEGFGLRASGFRLQESGIGPRDKNKIPKVIARAEPVAIYDFPLFLVLRPEFQSPNLKRRLPRLLIPYTLIFLSPPGERIEVRGTDPRTFFHPHPYPLPSREREIMEVAC